MSRCKCCDTEILGSEGRVFCNAVCKEIFARIKENVRNQNKEFKTLMKLECTTCKRKLVEGEDKYCTTCTDRMLREKEKRANTDHFRPCKDCKKDMKNPAPNRKRCEECAEKEADKKHKAHDLKRKERRVEVKKINKTEVHKGSINPMFLKPQGSKRRYNLK